MCYKVFLTGKVHKGKTASSYGLKTKYLHEIPSVFVLGHLNTYMNHLGLTCSELHGQLHICSLALSC